MAERRQVRDADLVLEGGGVKGTGLVGALAALDEAGYAYRRVAGTSAGAIVASLLAAGMSVPEMESVLAELDYTRFEDGGPLDRLGRAGQAVQLLLNGGMYLFKGDYLHEWLRDQLLSCEVLTWRDLRDDDPGSALPPHHRYRLVVIVSDVSRGRMLRLPWDYARLCGMHPDDVPVADAVRASASIPFFFKPVTLRCGTPVGGRPITLVDGGLLSNFPVDVFDRRPRSAARWPTFGIKLSARPDGPEQRWHPAQGPLSLLRSLWGTMASAHDQLHVDEPSVQSRTVFVDTTGVRATDFGLDEAAKRRLYESGYGAARTFLDSWDWEGWKARFPSEAAATVPQADVDPLLMPR